MTGSRFIAETLHGYGVTAVYFVPGILQQTLVDLEPLGIQRIMCQTDEKNPRIVPTHGARNPIRTNASDAQRPIGCTIDSSHFDYQQSPTVSDEPR